MSEEYVLMAPGPVNLHPEVRNILAQPMIHHRTPEFDKIFARVRNNMKNIFQTAQDVFLLTSTGSGGMEALLVNTIAPGDKVLAIISGKFGERWAEMARRFGAQVLELQVPWGHAVKVPDVQKILDANTDIKAVLCQACETSTAVAHPIRELGQAIRHYPDVLFLVDGITALGAYELPMDQWHIDGLVGGSQKAFMLPTGMAFLALSHKAWDRNQTVLTPRFYFDLREEKKANKKGETWFSSNVVILRALDYVVNDLIKKGLPAHFKQIERRALFVRYFANRLGMKNYSSNVSNSVSAIEVPAGIDSTVLREKIESIHNITIMGGQDSLKGKILRIGHMGYLTDQHQLRLMNALYVELVALGFSPALSQKQFNNEMNDWLQKNGEVYG